MELFDFIKIIFESPEEYSKITPGEKKKHFFMINRRMAIHFPEQAQLLQHLKIDEVSVIDSWQQFIRKQYKKVPYWMYTKGVKKSKEEKEKKIKIKQSTIKLYAAKNQYDLKSVIEAIDFFPKEMEKELKKFEKLI